MSVEEIEKLLAAQGVKEEDIEKLKKVLIFLEEQDVGPFEIKEAPPEISKKFLQNIEDRAAKIKEMEEMIDNLPEPAAGAALLVDESEGSHEPIFIEYEKPEVIPEAGFDTVGVSNEVSQIQNELRMEEVLQRTEASLDSLLDGKDEVPIQPDDDSSGDEEQTPPEEDVEPPVSNKGPVKGNNGFGNGDQDAPGNSENNNNAENAGGNHDGTVNAPGNSAHLDTILTPAVNLDMG